jgi:hypothetical protein
MTWTGAATKLQIIKYGRTVLAISRIDDCGCRALKIVGLQVRRVRNKSLGIF